MSDEQRAGPSRNRNFRNGKSKNLSEKELEAALFASDDEFSDFEDDPADYGWEDSDVSDDSDHEPGESVSEIEVSADGNSNTITAENIRSRNIPVPIVNWVQGPVHLKKSIH